MCWQHEAVEVIDDIICIVLKADKWQVLANNLKVLLLKTWDIEKLKAIWEVIDAFEKGEGDVKESDIKELISGLEAKLGEPLAEACAKIVADNQLKAYKMAFKNIDGKSTNVEFSFNKASKDVLKWLKENETYWIGRYFSTQITGRLDAELSEFSKQIFEKGLSRAEAGKLLDQACRDMFELPEKLKGSITDYWEGLADHITTRARAFGRLDAYKRAGVEYVKVIAVMDSRTSLICQNLNGRVFPLSHLEAQRDLIIAAQDPEEAKQYSQWLTNKEVGEHVKGKSIAEIMSGKFTKYIGNAPYHWKCRSDTVAATKEEFESQEKKD